MGPVDAQEQTWCTLLLYLSIATFISSVLRDAWTQTVLRKPPKT